MFHRRNQSVCDVVIGIRENFNVERVPYLFRPWSNTSSPAPSCLLDTIQNRSPSDLSCDPPTKPRYLSPLSLDTVEGRAKHPLGHERSRTRIFSLFKSRCMIFFACRNVIAFAISTERCTRTCQARGFCRCFKSFHSVPPSMNSVTT